MYQKVIFTRFLRFDTKNTRKKPIPTEILYLLSNYLKIFWANTVR